MNSGDLAVLHLGLWHLEKVRQMHRKLVRPRRLDSVCDRRPLWDSKHLATGMFFWVIRPRYGMDRDRMTVFKDAFIEIPGGGEIRP
jgi:hypothetical protein